MAKTHDEVQNASLVKVIDELSALSDGWDSYSAPAPTPESIQHARGLLESLIQRGYAIVHVGPSVLGGVGITIESEATEFAVEFRNSGKAVVTVIGDGGAFTVREWPSSNAMRANILSTISEEVG